MWLRNVAALWGMKIQVVVNFTETIQTKIMKHYVSLEKIKC